MALFLLVAEATRAYAQAVNVRPLYDATVNRLVEEAERTVAYYAARRAAVRFAMRFAGWAGLAYIAYEVWQSAWEWWRAQQLREVPGPISGPGPYGAQPDFGVGSVPWGSCTLVMPYVYMGTWMARLDGTAVGENLYGYGGSAGPAGALADLVSRVGKAMRGEIQAPWVRTKCFPQAEAGSSPSWSGMRTGYFWPGTSREIPAELADGVGDPLFTQTALSPLVSRVVEQLTTNLPDSMSLGDAARRGVSWSPEPTAEQLQGPGGGVGNTPASREEQAVQTGLLQSILERLGRVVELLEELPEKVAEAVARKFQELFVPRQEVVEQVLTRVQNAVRDRAPWGLATQAQRLADRLGGVGASCDFRLGTYQYLSASYVVDAGPVVCPIAGTVRGIASWVLVGAVVLALVRLGMPRLGL